MYDFLLVCRCKCSSVVTIFRSSYMTLKNIVSLKSRLRSLTVIDRIDFLLLFHSNCGPILYRIREKARFGWKSSDFYVTADWGKTVENLHILSRAVFRNQSDPWQSYFSSPINFSFYNYYSLVVNYYLFYCCGFFCIQIFCFYLFLRNFFLYFFIWF